MGYALYILGLCYTNSADSYTNYESMPFNK